MAKPINAACFRENRSFMDVAEILDWESADWSAVLAAARGDASAASAGALWSVYGPLIEATAQPLVIGQIGQSLDGRVATENGHSHYVNGPAALTHLHRLRALSDAVVIGVGTALADDPQLTVRHADGVDPMRVILDPNGRLPSESKCLAADGARRLVIRSTSRPVPKGVEEFLIPSRDGGLDPRDVIAALAAQGCKRILIEGGPNTLSRFVAAGTIDRLHLLIAPIIIGSGIPGLALPPIDHLRDALRPAIRAFRLPGDDLLCDCDLRA